MRIEKYSKNKYRIKTYPGIFRKEYSTTNIHRKLCSDAGTYR
nr:MAG TPA: hypothetical protein [Caudoviricetes sp.]